MFVVSYSVSIAAEKPLQYIQGALDKSCDAYLDELQESLREACGVDTSTTTIWRALKRSGYSMKKVKIVSQPIPIQSHTDLHNTAYSCSY
jgi:hypothetical protein